MQLFVRCGVPLGTLSVDCLPTDTVADMKDRLGKSSRRLQDAGLLVSLVLLAGQRVGFPVHNTACLGLLFP